MGFNKETGIYTPDNDIIVNGAEFTRTAQYFKKHGVYTKAHPLYDKREYDEFWDEEERRRREGYSVGGFYITGEHYGFLNFGQILRTNNPDDTANVFKDIRHSRKTGKKQLDFPDLWDGHVNWFRAKKVARDNGLHIVGGKSRRKGFSYIGGWSAFNNYDLYPGLTTIIGAFDNKYLIRGDGTMAMAKRYADFININTDWRKGRLVSTKDHLKSGYKIRGTDEERGFRSQILALSFKDNPDAAVGKDAYEIDLEELGVFPNIRDVLEITLPILEDGNLMTGQFIGWGTGGSKGANWEVFEEIYYNPTSFGCMSFENIWDKDATEGKGVGFFFPYVQNLVPYIDENGNSKKEEAKKASDASRARKKASTTNIHEYTIWVGQRANSPSEAFSRATTNLFSSKELTDHIDLVKHDQNIKNLPRCGILSYTKEGLRFVTNEELEIQGHEVHPPLLHHPFKSGEDLFGCIVEWQPPYRDPRTGQVPDNLYRIWNDPYAVDKDKKDITLKNSLGATYVYERANPFTSSRGDILVAAYVGRPESQDEYNEYLYRLCLYYGNKDGMLMFENDRGDVRRFFKAKKADYLLAEEPEITWKKELAPTKSGRTKGISMNSPNRKGNAAIYFKDWLYTKRGTDENGIPKLNLHYIYDLGLLEEIGKWNLSGNFDRMSAMLIGQFDMKEELEKAIEPEQFDEDDYFNRTLF